MELPTGLSIDYLTYYDVIIFNNKIYTLYRNNNKVYLYDQNGKIVSQTLGNYYNSFTTDEYLIVYGMGTNNRYYTKVFDLNDNQIFHINNAYATNVYTTDTNETVINADILDTVRSAIHFTIKSYKTTNGNDQVYDNEDLIVTFSGDSSLLDKVKVNNVELDESNYTMSSGSTVITLKNDYLATLDDGDYTLRVEYTDGGYAEAAFQVGIPDTYDGVVYYFMIAFVSIFILFIGLIYKRKTIKVVRS